MHIPVTLKKQKKFPSQDASLIFDRHVRFCDDAHPASPYPNLDTPEKAKITVGGGEGMRHLSFMKKRVSCATTVSYLKNLFTTFRTYSIFNEIKIGNSSCQYFVFRSISSYSSVEAKLGVRKTDSTLSYTSYC